MQGEYSSGNQTGRGHVAYISEKTGLMKVREIEYALLRGRAVFEGDIVINTEKGIAAARALGAKKPKAGATSGAATDVIRPGDILRGAVIVGGGTRWNRGVIPYTIDPGLPNQSRVTDAIDHWEERTPLRFPLRTDEADYVTFFSDPDGCSSIVGRQGGQQGVWLATDCTTGNAIHEIGHTIGLWHEQSREDRNSFVTIHYENIVDGKEHNFDQHIADGDDVGPYDYGSIMHYSRTAFSKNGLDTITPPAGVTIGQRDALSIGDMHAVTYMYPDFEYYVGNANTKELHIPGCRWVAQMSARNHRMFRSVEEAVQRGYNGCWYCNRYWDTG